MNTQRFNKILRVIREFEKDSLEFQSALDDLCLFVGELEGEIIALRLIDSQETKLCPETRTDGKGAKEESESSPNSFHLRQNPDTHTKDYGHKDLIDKDYPKTKKWLKEKHDFDYDKFDYALEKSKGTSTVQDLHETRLELMKEAKEKGMSYNDYVKFDDQVEKENGNGK